MQEKFSGQSLRLNVIAGLYIYGIFFPIVDSVLKNFDEGAFLLSSEDTSDNNQLSYFFLRRSLNCLSI